MDKCKLSFVGFLLTLGLATAAVANDRNIASSCATDCGSLRGNDYSTCMSNCAWLNGGRISHKECKECSVDFTKDMRDKEAKCAKDPGAFKKSVKEKYRFEITLETAQAFCGATIAKKPGAGEAKETPKKTKAK